MDSLPLLSTVNRTTTPDPNLVARTAPCCLRLPCQREAKPDLPEGGLIPDGNRVRRSLWRATLTAGKV